MGVKLLTPPGIWRGYEWSLGRWCFALLFHTLQCDQRWLFLIARGRRKFGYLTRGDATPNLMRYHDAGWWFPWSVR